MQELFRGGQGRDDSDVAELEGTERGMREHGPDRGMGGAPLSTRIAHAKHLRDLDLERWALDARALEDRVAELEEALGRAICRNERLLGEKEARVRAAAGLL